MFVFVLGDTVFSIFVFILGSGRIIAFGDPVFAIFAFGDPVFAMFVCFPGLGGDNRRCSHFPSPHFSCQGFASDLIVSQYPANDCTSEQD